LNLTDRMRIGLVISELFVGGAEKNFVALAEGLRDLGHIVFVYSLDSRPEPGKDMLVCRLENRRISVEFLGCPGRRIGMWASISALKKALVGDRVEVIQSFLFRANLVATLAKPNSVPLAIGLRVADPRPWVKIIEKWCIRKSAATVCVSGQVANYYAVGISQARSETQVGTGTPTRRGRIGLTIPNGVSLPSPLANSPGKATDTPRQSADWEGAEVSSASDEVPSIQAIVPSKMDWNRWFESKNAVPKIILYVGRLTPQKGLGRLIEMIDDVLQKQSDAHLVLIGDGDQKDELVAHAAKCLNGGQIHFLGWQPNPQDFIQACDLLVLSSKWEGMPNVVLEAMASRKPFVSFHTHGLEDIFNAGKSLDHDCTRESAATAFSVTDDNLQTTEAQVAFHRQVVSETDRPAFVKQVLAFLASEKLSKRTGDWNHQWVKQHFCVAELVRRYEQLFLELAGR